MDPAPLRLEERAAAAEKRGTTGACAPRPTRRRERSRQAGPGDGVFTVSGHVHPVTYLPVPGGRRLRVPVLDQGRGVLALCVVHPLAGDGQSTAPPGVAHDLAAAGADLGRHAVGLGPLLGALRWPITVYSLALVAMAACAASSTHWTASATSWVCSTSAWWLTACRSTSEPSTTPTACGSVDVQVLDVIPQFMAPKFTPDFSIELCAPPLIAISDGIHTDGAWS